MPWQTGLSRILDDITLPLLRKLRLIETYERRGPIYEFLESHRDTLQSVEFFSVQLENHEDWLRLMEDLRDAKLRYKVFIVRRAEPEGETGRLWNDVGSFLESASEPCEIEGGGFQLRYGYESEERSRFWFWQRTRAWTLPKESSEENAHEDWIYPPKRVKAIESPGYDYAAPLPQHPDAVEEKSGIGPESPEEKNELTFPSPIWRVLSFLKLDPHNPILLKYQNDELEKSMRRLPVAQQVMTAKEQQSEGELPLRLLMNEKFLP